ncbi:MAG: hypothetical protein DMF76_10180 [Acidobacteria bacterium]|nr:MAG: hypothetical protein DMF76_10180 [Acidobacteriota bacterium]
MMRAFPRRVTRYPKMDPTVLAALAGVIGAIVGAVLGGVFALKAAKRQVEVMLRHSRGDVNERLYKQSLEILQFIAENPEVRPYFYDNKEIARAVNELERLKVLSTAEMVGGFMELVALQIEDQPAEIQPRWKAYILDQYNSSAVLRDHIATCKAWYADDLLRLLPPRAAESATHKTLASRHA